MKKVQDVIKEGSSLAFVSLLPYMVLGSAEGEARLEGSGGIWAIYEKKYALKFLLRISWCSGGF
jgi:hypothetical protein